MSYLVKNPEDRFSCDEAQFMTANSVTDKVGVDDNYRIIFHISPYKYT